MRSCELLFDSFLLRFCPRTYLYSAEDQPHATQVVRPRAKTPATAPALTDQARYHAQLGNAEPGVDAQSVQPKLELEEPIPANHTIDCDFPEPEEYFIPEPTLLTSTPMRIDSPTGILQLQLPPSPPLTANSSMSRVGSFRPKVFDVLTQDPWGSRTFFVACQGGLAVESFIKVCILKLVVMVITRQYTDLHRSMEE